MVRFNTWYIILTKSCRKFRRARAKSSYTKMLLLRISVDSIAQMVERRSRNPNMRVRIPLETTNFSLFSAV